VNSNWKECKLGACLERVIDNRGKTPPLANNATPYGLIEVNALTGSSKLPNYRAIHKYVSEETYETWFRSGHPKKGDVLFATVGTIAETAILNEDRGSIAQNLIALRPINEALASDFLYYHFITPSTKQMLMSLDISSVQPSIKVPHLLDTDILLPPLPEQRAIAGVLSSLDDKIDLLHRQNKTLEGMAEALWRKMFVEEADPGWKKGKLGDYGKFKNGINYSRNENGDTEYSILNVRDIVESKYVNVGNFEKVSINNSKATPYLLEKGDIVIVRSASPGESLIVLDEIDKLIYSGFSIRMRCYDKKQSLFLFQFLQSYKKEMDIFSDGTTLKNINQEILNSIELITPERDTVKEFNDRVIGFYNKILLNQGQISTLSRLRDTLLPKLMSGEVRVKL